MAESSKVISVPDILANSDNARFAEDMVGYVILLNTPTPVSKKDQGEFRELTSAFDQKAQRAVECIEVILKKNNDDTFREMEKTHSLTLFDYRRFAYEESLKCSDKTFDANIFLIFCVCISNMAALFYNRGILKAPVVAVMQIMYSLAKYDVPASGWDALRRIAESLDNMLKVSEQTPQSTPSCGTEPLNMLQREVSRYESMNSSLSRESDLPESEEKK